MQMAADAVQAGVLHRLLQQLCHHSFYKLWVWMADSAGGAGICIAFSKLLGHSIAGHQQGIVSARGPSKHPSLSAAWQYAAMCNTHGDTMLSHHGNMCCLAMVCAHGSTQGLRQVWAHIYACMHASRWHAKQDLLSAGSTPACPGLLHTSHTQRLQCPPPVPSFLRGCQPVSLLTPPLELAGAAAEGAAEREPERPTLAIAGRPQPQLHSRRSHQGKGSCCCLE